MSSSLRDDTQIWRFPSTETHLRWLIISGMAIWLAAMLSPPALADERPNIVILFADDLGYSDLGCYGGEIETPHLDRLAREGLRFTQFYNTARCWPSRAALMTGYYAQQVRRDAFPEGGGGGARGTRPEWAPLLSQRLKVAGYRCYHSGKWHIDGARLAGGFDHSYSVEDHNNFFHPQRHLEDDRPLPAVPRGTDYYVTTAIADHAVRCLREHATAHESQPFFAYVAFTAPHFPLQAPAADIAKYAEKYRVGWDAICEARWQRQRELGLSLGERSPREPNVGPPYDFPADIEKLGPGEVNRPLAWSELTPEQRELQAAKMAVHAAMVDRMDQEIGRILEQLAAMPRAENTLVMFLSDNGASAEIMVRGDGHSQDAAPGSAETFLCLGPGWSTAANTPFRRHKTWVHEGGIATPFIVHWPALGEQSGTIRSTPAHVIDIVPTVLDAVGQPAGSSKAGDAPALPGVSLLPIFRGDGLPADRELWWLHEGNRAMRRGRWKLVAAGKTGRWELYDFTSDRTELHDLAQVRPEIVEELSRRWEELTARFRNDATPAPADRGDPR